MSEWQTGPVVSAETVLEAVRDHYDRCGYPPTVREIMLATGIRSASTVSRKLTQLHKAGLVVRRPYTARGIELVER